jgi:hypothetical protein
MTLRVGFEDLPDQVRPGASRVHVHLAPEHESP